MSQDPTTPDLQTPIVPQQSPVPPHFHHDDRVAEKDLIPNGDYVTVVPTWAAPEGTQVLYLNGSDFRIYRMLDGAWRYISATTFNSSAHAHLSADQALAGASTATQVKLDVEDFDGNGEFTPSNPFYGFYPSQTGRYQVNAMVRFDDGASTETFTGMIYKTGSEFLRTNEKPGGSVPVSCFLAAVVYLVGNTDNIQLWGACSNSARKFLSNGSQPGCYLSIHRLS